MPAVLHLADAALEVRGEAQLLELADAALVLAEVGRELDCWRKVLAALLDKVGDGLAHRDHLLSEANL